MPIFLILVLLFCAWFFYERKKAERMSEAKTKSFWERESEANSTIRKDTSDVPYISVDFAGLPFDTESNDPEITDVQNTLYGLRGKSIANLSEYTNTDLKLKYGVPNFKQLSESDENYNTLVTTLEKWGKLLVARDNLQDAELVYKAALHYGLDSTGAFLGLANIYANEGKSTEIQSLLADAATITAPTKEATLSSLREALARSYSMSAENLINQS